MNVKVLKLKLIPDRETAEILDGQSKICNWAYNTLLEQANQLKKTFIETQDPAAAKVVYTERGLRNLLPQMKTEHPFLKVVHSSPMKNTALRLSSSIQDFQKSKKGKRAGKKTKWPKFRSWKRRWFSLFYDEPGKGFKVQDNHLKLSLGMGQDRKQRSIVIPLENAHLLKGKEVHNARVIQDNGDYYVVFTISNVVPATKPCRKVLAIDPNHKNFGYGVDHNGKGIEIAAPHWMKVLDKRADEVKSKRDRCKRKAKKCLVLDTKGIPTGTSYWEPSRNWKKHQKVYEKILRIRREQTKTYLYTLSHALFQRYDCVGIGDYTPDGGGLTKPMRRAMNNQSMIGRFKKVLEWVALKSGKTFFEYDEKGTTRTCHACEKSCKGGIAPHIRKWICERCHTEHHRDENAAINGLRRVIKNNRTSVLSVPGSGLFQITERWAWRVLPRGVVTTNRGQNGEKITAPRNENKGMVALDQNDHFVHL